MSKQSLVIRLSAIAINISIRFSCKVVLFWKRMGRETVSREYPIENGLVRIEEPMELRIRGSGERTLKTTLSLVIRTRGGEKMAGVANLPITLKASS
jgi:hypothetical protein